MTPPRVPAGVPPTGDEAAAPATHGARRSRARLWWTLAAVVAVLGGLTAAAFLVELPYYLVQPGGVRPAEQRVEVEGARTHPDTGEVLFTTVFLNRATPALMVRAWLDDAVEVRTEEEMYPDGDPDAAREANLARMDTSKLVATSVALDELGVASEVTADGALVVGLVESGPADGVLRPEDVIVEVDGSEVALPDDIAGSLDDRRPGDVVEVTVRREDGTAEEELVLGESPDQEGRPILGVQVAPANPRVASDVQVEVDSGEVSGPSAGLAWTLAIIDELTPGSLTGERPLAVTGEILPDGTVGAVGGVVQKLSAVAREGHDRFMFPASTPAEEQRRMREIAGDHVELLPVEDIDDAVEVLAPSGLEPVTAG